MIGHAGLNSTLECLERGVPLVAIPLNADQPGIAARIRHFGVGELLEPANLDAARLGRAVARVMGNPRYRRNAAAMSQQIRRSGGVTAAGDIVERALGLAAGAA